MNDVAVAQRRKFFSRPASVQGSGWLLQLVICVLRALVLGGCSSERIRPGCSFGHVIWRGDLPRQLRRRVSEDPILCPRLQHRSLNGTTAAHRA